MTDPKWTAKTALAAGVGAGLLGGAALLGGWMLAALLGGIFGDREAQVADERRSSRLPISQSLFSEVQDSLHAAPAPAFAERYMAAVAHPAAAQTAARVLEDGGAAIDALIAAQMVLNLVEPQSSGIGGGGFLLYWDAESETLTTYDGRETAPAAADGSLFYGADGEPHGYFDALTGGRSVGAPGLLRMLEAAHGAHGNKDFAALLDPAARMAERGFPVSPRLNSLLGAVPTMKRLPSAEAFFYDDAGAPWPVGRVLKNPAFAETLRTIQTDGVDAFYEGPIAEAIVAAVQESPINPGVLSLEDMAGYEAKVRPNLCAPYRIFQVCGMPPPSSGGLTVLQILKLLEGQRIGLFPPVHAESVQRFAEAMKLAHADRDRYIGDPDFAEIPVAGMLDPDYLVERATLMDLSDGPKRKAAFGRPPGAPAGPDPRSDDGDEPPSTTHLTIVDESGDVAVMTSSIEFAFGSGLFVGGFLLNNQLTDFAWPSTPRPESGVHPNEMQGGKRPRSSMSPTLVFGPNGSPRLAVGSPGGSRIIGYTAQAVLGVLEWDLTIQEAVELPHYLNRNGPLELEEGTDAATLADEMAARGYEVEVKSMTSGLHGIEIIAGQLIGGADPRREGRAIGERQLDPRLFGGFEAIIPDYTAPE
ncbi:MAG: gamma-glutamyltransferase [Marivibrio sp.]|uniref:gamma-glutamyltransferase n=1 Tax=Marivibrio sp. TaxID=2039719 RepID=UPI0032EB55E2